MEGSLAEGQGGEEAVRAMLRANGRLDLIRGGPQPGVVGNLVVAAHLKNWRWVEPRKAVLEPLAKDKLLPQSLPSDGKLFPEARMLTKRQRALKLRAGRWMEEADLLGLQRVLGFMRGGAEDQIYVHAYAQAIGSIEIEAAAVPTKEIEPEVCSLALHLRIASPMFEDGLVGFQSSLKLPPKGSEARSDYNPFGQPAQNYVDITHFTVLSADSRVGLDITIHDTHPTSKRVGFVDIRKWAPQFDVRIGDCSGGFNWAPTDVRRWRVSIRAFANPSSKLRVYPLRFESLAVTLEERQLRTLRDEGYLVMSDLIPREALHTALRALNRSIGKGFPENEVAKMATTSWCPELRSSPLLTNLFTATKVRGVVDALLGAENVPDWAGNSVQIALRFPTDPPAQPMHALGRHIDGIPTDTNGLEKGRLHPFTLLVGIYLNDTEEDSGNLIVYPGSHLEHAALFKKEKPEEVLLNTVPFKMPPIRMNPVQTRPRFGDVIFAHYLLAHSVASNVSPFVRYALYFRVASERRQGRSYPYEDMTDAWLDWPAITQLPQ